MDVFASPNHQNQLQGPLRFLFTGHYMFFTTRPEQPEHEADHWPTPCTEVKNEWSDTTTVTCLCGVHSNSFTSTFYFSRYMTQQPHSLLYFQFKTADFIPQLSFKQKEFCDNWNKYSLHHDVAVSLLIATQTERPLFRTAERLYCHHPQWILVVTRGFRGRFYLTTHLKCSQVERW